MTGAGATLSVMPPPQVCLGPMAPMLSVGVEELIRDIGHGALRRYDSWARLLWDVSATPAALVLVGIEEEFDRARAHSLSVDCPGVRVIAFGLRTAELTVMHGGTVVVSCELTPESLRDAIAAA